MPNRNSQTEGVIIILEDNEPKYMVRKNGEVVYYLLEKMSFGDHEEMLGVQTVQVVPTTPTLNR